MNESEKQKKQKVVQLKRPSNEPAAYKDVGGSNSDDWNQRIALETLSTLWLKNSNAETQEKQYQAALAGLIGISPRDELEAMMAAQLIASHTAAMECYRRAMIGEQTFEGRRENLNQANKLSRTHAALLEAFNRHRGKGQQKVTVEHVHVHAGGQAIVGNVNGPGGGGATKPEEQPHASQIPHASEPPLPSTDAGRKAVPVASDDQRPLSDARRPIARSADG